MDKKPIRLTEQDLHFLVENAVQAYLTENEANEGVWGGVKNAWNAIKNGNFNVGNAYRTGNDASSFQKYANQAEQTINQMIAIADSTNNQRVSAGLKKTLKNIQFVAQQYNQIAQNATQQQPQQVNTVKWQQRTPKTQQQPQVGNGGTNQQTPPPIPQP